MSHDLNRWAGERMLDGREPPTGTTKTETTITTAKTSTTKAKRAPVNDARQKARIRILNNASKRRSYYRRKAGIPPRPRLTPEESQGRRLQYARAYARRYHQEHKSDPEYMECLRERAEAHYWAKAERCPCGYYWRRSHASCAQFGAKQTP